MISNEMVRNAHPTSARQQQQVGYAPLTFWRNNEVVRTLPVCVSSNK
ncbi:MAG: hypothetical protein R3F37_10975 [Candidatus Competibacteraceae bacterium]